MRPPDGSSTTPTKTVEYGFSSGSTVSGKVTLEGKPVSGGEISFDPSNVERPMEPPRMAPIGEDGTYKITTLVGDNTVTVSSPAANQTRDTSQKVISVQPGENTADIELGTSG